MGFHDELTATQELGGTSVRDTTRHGAPDFFGIAIPFQAGGRNLTLQASYQRAVDLYGQGRATVSDTVDLSELVPDGRGTVEVIADIAPEQAGAFHTVSLAAGYQATSRLSLGLAANYWLAEWTAEGSASFRAIARVPGVQQPLQLPLSETEFVQDQSVRGLNLNAGFLLRYPWLSVGGVVRLPFTGDYELSENGQRTFYEVGRPLPPEPVDVKVTTRIHWPRSAGVGVALRPFRGLTLARDFSRSHWSRTFIEDVPGGVLLTAAEEDDNGETVESFTDRNFFDLLPASQTSTVDTEQLRAGLEYLVVIPKVVIPLRAGIFRDQSPVSDLASDEGRDIEGWTVGTGFNFKHVVLDVAYERRESEGVVALRLRGGQPGRGAALRETVREERFVASLIYRFGDNDPLKRLFRYIFVGHSEDDAS